jgi:hypothetical protein
MPHTTLALKEEELFGQPDQKLEASLERQRLRPVETIQSVA